MGNNKTSAIGISKWYFNVDCEHNYSTGLQGLQMSGIEFIKSLLYTQFLEHTNPSIN